MSWKLLVMIMGVFIALTIGWLWLPDKAPKSNIQLQNVQRNIPEKKIVIIIPSYKNEHWYKKNLDSVFNQKYQNYHVVYINDCSPDNTYSFIEKYIDEHNLHNKITLINNSERCGALANLYNAIHACADHDIVVTLDGDDWLAHENVLARINQEYADHDTWMTYGQYEVWPSGGIGLCKEIPTIIRWANLFRSYTWVASHPRTFYAGLFKKIKKEDLLYEGEFFDVTWDRAFMFPMLEMAGQHAHFIPDILYSYNNNNPISDGKIALKRVMRCERYIRSMRRYQLLKNLLAANEAEKLYG